MISLIKIYWRLANESNIYIKYYIQIFINNPSIIKQLLVKYIYENTYNNAISLK